MGTSTPLLIGCLSLALLAACSGGGEQAVTSPGTGGVPTQSVAVVPSAAPVAVGQTVQLSVTALDTAGNSQILAVTWSSSDTTKATVSNQGVVTGVAVGTVTITATPSSTSIVGKAAVTVNPAPPPATGALTYAAVSVGRQHTCALARSGIAYCWGYDEQGQLGNDTTATSGFSSPVPVAGGLTFSSLSAGTEHTCALTPAGAAYCWGTNQQGQLGDSSTTTDPTPVPVAGGVTFASIAAADHFTCGIARGGASYCWGKNTLGQLGDSLIDSTLTPTAVAGGLTFAMMSAAASQACGLVANGAAYCWGQNNIGQLGNGTTFDSATSKPAAVVGGVSFSAVSVGAVYSCGVSTAGAAYCWGANQLGGMGSAVISASAPVPVMGGFVFKSIQAGNGFTCALTPAGAAYCWGDNSIGQLGIGTTISNSLTPVAVTGGLVFSSLSVSAEGGHVCGLTAAGSIYCWGNNALGQLGNGTTSSFSNVPVQVGVTPASSARRRGGRPPLR